MIFIGIVMFMQSSNAHAQVCSQAAVAACAPYTCIATDNIYSCLCPDFQVAQTAAGCRNVTTVTTTISSVVVPNQCANAACPAGATCVPTSQNPPLYVCVCPNNIISFTSCTINPLPNNPCLLNNPCRNGGTCVVNPLAPQAICICPSNTYGRNCAYACRPACNFNW